MAVILKITKDVSFMGSNPIFSEYSMYYPPFLSTTIFILQNIGFVLPKGSIIASEDGGCG